MATTIQTIETQPSPIDELAPPFLLRFGSMIIDYIILLVLPIGGLLSDRFFAGGLDIVTDRTLWFLAVIFSLVNLVILPVLVRRSIGKWLSGLRIVKADGSEASTFAVFARQTIGYLLTAGTLGLGFILSVFSSRGRTLQDLVTGTAVIRAARI